MGQKRKFDGFVVITVIISAVGTPHSVLLFSGFVWLHQAEARQIKEYKNILYNSPLLWNEENKKYIMVTKIDVQENSQYVHIYIYL